MIGHRRMAELTHAMEDLFGAFRSGTLTDFRAVCRRPPGHDRRASNPGSRRSTRARPSPTRRAPHRPAARAAFQGHGRTGIRGVRDERPGRAPGRRRGRSHRCRVRAADQPAPLGGAGRLRATLAGRLPRRSDERVAGSPAPAAGHRMRGNGHPHRVGPRPRGDRERAGLHRSWRCWSAAGRSSFSRCALAWRRSTKSWA